MLKSNLLSLRAVEPCDADFMYEIENDPGGWRYGETIAPLSRKIIREYALTYDADPFSAGQLRLIIESCDNGAPVGIIDLYEINRMHSRAFVGIYILPPFRERGFATDALKLLEEYSACHLRLRLLAARIESINIASSRLFEKAGYSCNAVLRDWFLSTDGSFSDLLIYSKYLKRKV